MSDAVYTNMKMKRARAHGSTEKSILALYNKLCVLVSNLAELLDIQILTDSTVLMVSVNLIINRVIVTAVV